MKRIQAWQKCQVNSNYAQEDLVPDPQEKVTFDILGGTISFVVPPDLPDDQLLQENWIERDAFTVLKLENGAELRLWMNEDTCGVDVQTPKCG